VSNYERADHREHGKGTCRRRALAAAAASEAPLVAEGIAELNDLERTKAIVARRR
jgi:hypothetical protein